MSEIIDALTRVVNSGQFILGEELAAFERELAEYLGVKHVIGVSSGTDALTLALKAMGVGEGDEVLVPALTFIATAEAVIHAGATPVFTDVDPATWVMTPEMAEPHLSEKTKALVPVHLFGNPAPVDELQELGLPILEDACQAIGSTYQDAMVGSLGDAAAFSFYPSKTLGGIGDGGAIATGSDEIAHQVRLLRHHGSEDGQHHELVGGTHRLDEIQAAALRVRLRDLPDQVEARKLIGQVFNAIFAKEAQRPTPGSSPAWNLLVMCPEFRDAMKTVISESGEEPRSYYTTPVHRQPAMRPYYRRSLPNAEWFASHNLAMPFTTADILCVSK